MAADEAEAAERRARIFQLVTQGIYFCIAGYVLWHELAAPDESLLPKRCPAGDYHWLRWDQGRHCACRLEEGRYVQRVAADEAESEARLRYLMRRAG